MAATQQGPIDAADLPRRITYGFRLCDGILWGCEGPNGRSWGILWQPGHASHNLRAFHLSGPNSMTPGRDRLTASAATEEDARAMATAIAADIAAGNLT
jgi:hypothetical protein